MDKPNKLRVRFRHLTDYQRQIICNGCGPKGLFIKPPDFMFRASCDHHDFNYWIGCNRLHRKKADLQFYREMLKDAGSDPWYKFWAGVYYRVVRWFGARSFYWGKKQRDLHDLIKYIIEQENL